MHRRTGLALRLAAVAWVLLAAVGVGGSDVAAGDWFNVTQALSDLGTIARTPHSLNDERSIGVRDFLRQTIGAIVASAEGGAQFDDPVGSGAAAEFARGGAAVYWEDSSLVVRMNGSGSAREALLVQAHYDAVPLSHGAYDDGVGVAVCLELLRMLARRPARHAVVVNIDWGEESGLFGAAVFARFHAWADDVRAYINLEAGGVGGRATVFRASHPALLAAYARAVRSPSASLVGDNAFRLGVVRSDTDYSVYTTRYGVPGLDMAFTDGRSLYHTARDAAPAATAASVRSMGDAVLAAARAIADDAHLLASIPRSTRLPPRPHGAPDGSARPGTRRLLAAGESFGARRTAIRIDAQRHVVVEQPAAGGDGDGGAVHSAVFYDVLQRVMVVRSYAAETLLSAATGVFGVAAVVALQLPFARPLPPLAGAVDWAAASVAERLVLQLGRGGFFGAVAGALFALAAAYGAALLAALGATGLLLNLVAPRLAYTHVVLYVLLLLAATAGASTYVLAAWACRVRRADAAADAATAMWYAWCVLRCLVLAVVAAPLSAAGIGLLYRELPYCWAAIAAAGLTALADPHTGVGQRWRRALQRRAAPSAAGEHHERLLADDSQPDADADAEAAAAHSAAAPEKLVLAAIGALRMAVGVVAPLVVGMDVMVRQLAVFKDHLVDGSPPIACAAIAALDLATFVLFLAPYTVGIVADADGCWAVGVAGRALGPLAGRLLAPRRAGPGAPAGGAASPHARSQISLHTNHAADSRDSFGDMPPHLRLDDSDGDDADAGRIIDLGSDARSPRASIGSDDASDDELGSRPPPARKGESPETVGLRLVCGWAALWVGLWVVVQLVSLGGEGYGDSANPMKVRAFQTTRMSAECLRRAATPAAAARCVYSRLDLSAPDSHGLARLVQAAAADSVPRVCYTQSSRDFYRCVLVDRQIAGAAAGAWAPQAAISVTAITHSPTPASHGTLFTVSLNFTAPESRTCFIDFGRQKGFSMQAYPNPAPSLPPPQQQQPPSLPPIIGRAVLPVIERATFVNGVTGAAASVVEPIRSRDPVYSNRIFAHKRDFDPDGRFSAVIQYSVPTPNATVPAGASIELSCYFDVADRHTPLLASIMGASPKWSVFTPAGNALSTVTLTDVRI
ncbi:hypothetical protein GGI15_001886 [Coemansia interrupta]|uniref:Peptide hydrolase n=1 Tax=Coemansia interrupta TaxID=1126814 RepID=A0A9W8HNF3_9FUNG|nr:hypothetical protein GGI15_001886 [Coemansia interrupta]